MVLMSCEIAFYQMLIFPLFLSDSSYCHVFIYPHNLFYRLTLHFHIVLIQSSYLYDLKGNY